MIKFLKHIKSVIMCCSQLHLVIYEWHTDRTFLRFPLVRNPGNVGGVPG